MKKYPVLILLLVSAFLVCTCSSDDALDPKTKSLVDAIESELTPLTNDPILWKDEELQFLNSLKDYSIIGLGEATHGTAEFFKAKHRILKYLVENHGYRVFAIEADVGESLFINEAVQKSDKDAITNLMKSKMHFWTWKTEEVRDLLYWMCDYNVGKSDADKVNYMGIDCQYNTYHPDIVSDYLADVNVPFFLFAEDVLNESETASAGNFSAYNNEDFNLYTEKIKSLKDSLVKYETDIIEASSEKAYDLNTHLIDVIRQTSEVIYYTRKQNSSTNYRDLYMAENTRWLLDYFNSAKIVLWAHNWHVSNIDFSGTMGHHLKDDLPGNYYSIGFLFSQGLFTAFTQSGNQYIGLNTQTLDSKPKTGSLNDLMSKADPDVFSVRISDLQKHDEWGTAFLNGVEYFQMGATYNNQPLNYYSSFRPKYLDQLIYFDHTTAAVQLK